MLPHRPSSHCWEVECYNTHLGRIHHYLDDKSTERLVHAFITSWLDINNGLYVGLPDTLLHKLQRLQNAAARLIVKLPKHSHITAAH